MYNFKQDTTQESRENPIHALRRQIKSLELVAQAAKAWTEDSNRRTAAVLRDAVKAWVVADAEPEVKTELTREVRRI